MSCLLGVGIGSEEETAHDSTPDALGGRMRFGVYEIDRREDGSLYELGRGAMGVTYRATDTTLQCKVALKVIKTDIAERSADARERFTREARAAAALRHEHIATIHQFGMRLETGQYFYAMELIEGETLNERVRRVGPVDARTAIEIAQQVTSALAAAEKQGLVHRDLKPANLMLVSRDGETTNKKKLLVKIIDFGLAKAIHTQTDPKSLTHDRFVGTPAFASPEQFEHSVLDVRSDIYSLGATLWFALTGKTPFSGRTMEDIRRAQKSNVLPIEQLKAARVFSRLRSLLQSMLALEAVSRPGTQELAARLKRCSPEARSAQRMRVALAASVLLVLAVSATFIFLHYFRSKRDLPTQIYTAIGVNQRRRGKWAESTANLEKAAALDPENAMILFQLALNYVALHNFDAADKTLDRASAAAPHALGLVGLKVYLAVLSKGDLTLAEKELSSNAAGTDPDGLVTWTRWWLLMLQRNFPEALAVAEKFPGEILFPGTAGPVPKALLKGYIHWLQGNKPQAKTEFEQARIVSENLLREVPETSEKHAQHGLILAALGRKQEAIAEGKRAVELLPESNDAFDGPKITASLAKIYALTGESDKAFRLIDHLLQVPNGLTVPILKLDPAWDPLRKDLQFQELCKAARWYIIVRPVKPPSEPFWRVIWGTSESPTPEPEPTVPLLLQSAPDKR